MGNYKKERRTNNCQNDINSLKSNKNMSNNPQEIVSTFNVYLIIS